MTNEQRIMHLLQFLGWDDWSNEEREWYCFTLAALCHAYKTGATGDKATEAANAFLADHGRKPLPSGFSAIS